MGLTTKEISSSSFNDMISSVDRRSEYVENRAGANVRLNNFLTPYTLDDKSSILNAPCGYSNGVYASLRPVATYGAELVTNGNFDTDSDWSKGAGWSISGGKANVNATSFTDLYQNIGTVVGKTYKISFEVSNYVSGSVKIILGYGSTPELPLLVATSNGVYEVETTPNAINPQNIYISTKTANTQLSIDNVSVKEVFDADFTFTRGSAATRVTKDGLIKNVQILSDELVQNGNFEEIGSEEVSNGDFEQIGSEEITNGNFSTSGTPNTSSWSLGWYSNTNNVIISDGKLTMTNSASESDARAYATNGTSSNNIITTNKFYKLQYDIVSNNGVTDFRYYSEAGVFVSVPSVEVGSYTIYIRNTSNSLFLFQNRTSNSSISIDNVSVKEVGQDWGFSSQSEFTEQGARVYSSNGSYQYIVQNNILTIGKQYKVTFDVISTNGASLASGTGAFIYDTSTTGSKTFYINADDAGFMLKRLSGVTDVTIDNISVKEVGQNWTFGTGWSVGDGKAIHTGVQSLLTQNNVFTSGIKYKISFDLTGADSFNYVRLLPSHYTGGRNFTTSGTNVVYVTANVSALYIYGVGDVSIDNISVIEITDDTDLPRIDYTDGTGSLLLEPQSTNLITYSEDFSDGSWNTARIETPYIANVVSPDGTLNAYTLEISSGETNGGGVYKTGISITGDNSYSVFAKKKTADYLVISDTGTISYAVYFNLENGTVGTEYNATGQIEYFGNGWYRCTMKYNLTSSGFKFLYVSNIDGQTTNGVQGGDSIYLWGAQLEESSYATSYIPTSGSTVTRNADVCNNSGSSDLINSTEGVLYFEGAALANDGSLRLMQLSDGTNNNRVSLYYDVNLNTIYSNIVVGGSSNPFSYNANILEYLKVAVKWKENDFAFWVNGTEAATDTSGSTFTPNTLNDLSFYLNGSYNFYGNVKCVAVFKEALTDEELAKITSTTQQEAFYEMRDKMLQINADYYEFGDYTTRLKKLF